MRTALHRSGLGLSEFSQANRDFTGHKDLVAYWAFEDGPGFRVKDVTGRGHDLYALAETEWQASLSGWKDSQDDLVGTWVDSRGHRSDNSLHLQLEDF